MSTYPNSAFLERDIAGHKAGHA